MALTPESLDRRVTALEKAAETEKSIIRAVSEIVAGSETRLRAEMNAMEQRYASALNDTEQRILAAIDRLHNPPR